jgi:hypothetical protein
MYLCQDLVQDDVVPLRKVGDLTQVPQCDEEGK